MEAYGLLMIAAVLFCVLLAILWICLPFAVFGIKDRLDTLIKLQREVNGRRG